MRLSEIIALKPEQNFSYKGIPAKVVWTEFTDEHVGETQSGIESMYFVFKMPFESIYKGITLRSVFPSPQNLRLPDYEYETHK